MLADRQLKYMLFHKAHSQHMNPVGAVASSVVKHTHTFIYIYITFCYTQPVYRYSVCISVKSDCQDHKINSSNMYTKCPRRKGPNFGRVFLRSNYTDITQNTHIQISMVTEILAREKCGLEVRGQLWHECECFCSSI